MQVGDLKKLLSKAPDERQIVFVESGDMDNICDISGVWDEPKRIVIVGRTQDKINPKMVDNDGELR